MWRASPSATRPGSPEEIWARLAAYIAALRAAREAGGAWSYHSYSLPYTTDLAKEQCTSLRYWMLRDVPEGRAPEVADLPLGLTGAGIDRGGNPDEDGWRARGGQEKFTSWPGWYDEQLRKDDYVLGATRFQSGCMHGWASFEVEPVAGWLAAHLRADGLVRS